MDMSEIADIILGGIRLKYKEKLTVLGIGLLSGVSAGKTPKRHTSEFNTAIDMSQIDKGDIIQINNTIDNILDIVSKDISKHTTKIKNSNSDDINYKPSIIVVLDLCSYCYYSVDNTIKLSYNVSYMEDNGDEIKKKHDPVSKYLKLVNESRVARTYDYRGMI